MSAPKALPPPPFPVVVTVQITPDEKRPHCPRCNCPSLEQVRGVWVCLTCGKEPLR